MTAKPLVPRERADRDVREAIDYYRDVDTELAIAFADVVIEAYERITARPATGSPRWADLLQIGGLRSQALKRFPYLVFYIEQPDHIDVLRILHRQRDIPAWMDGD